MAETNEPVEMSMQDALMLSTNPENMEVVQEVPTPNLLQPEPAPAEVPPTVTDVPVAGGDQGEVKPASTPGSEPIPEPAPDPSAPTFDEAAWIKQHFGEDYGDVETIKAKLTTPQPAAPKAPEFVNEESKRIYESLLAGQDDELAKYLEQKHFLKSLATKEPGEVIKAGLKAEYGLNEAQAERKFQKQFEVDDMLDDEDREIEQKIMDRRIAAEADRYRNYFAENTPEITLPPIGQPDAAQPAPEDTTAAKQAYAYASELAKGVKTEQTTIPYLLKDESLGLDYKGKVELPKAKIEEIRQGLNGHGEQYLAARYIKEDGTFNDELFARLVYIDSNLDKIIEAAVVDAKTQTWKAKLKADRNYQGENVVAGDVDSDPIEARRKAYRDFWG